MCWYLAMVPAGTIRIPWCPLHWYLLVLGYGYRVPVFLPGYGYRVLIPGNGTWHHQAALVCPALLVLEPVPRRPRYASSWQACSTFGWMQFNVFAQNAVSSFQAIKCCFPVNGSNSIELLFSEGASSVWVRRLLPTRICETCFPMKFTAHNAINVNTITLPAYKNIWKCWKVDLKLRLV